MIKVAVCGACGRMGQEVVKAVVNENSTELTAAIDIANVGFDIGEIILNKKLNVNIEKCLKTALEKSKIDVLVDFTS
ncbi:MAG: hypothetical protein PHV68_04125, partial [Candidatus Gastranaerophilales bacterium]|nr:hypothetical protein [Candidatus Gastranaerophilales bacterium]